MLLFCVGFLLIVYILLMPAFLFGRKKGTNLNIDYVMPLASLLVWMITMIVGVGCQSLGNTVELFVLAFVLLFFIYLKALYLNYHVEKIRQYSWVIFIILCIVPILMRLFTPCFSEWEPMMCQNHENKFIGSNLKNKLYLLLY